MGLYLPVRARGSAAIAICGRCSFKFHYDELVKDPNNGLWVCKDCCDVYDPWRLPARQAENITLDHPRPDTQVIVTSRLLVGFDGLYLITETGAYIDWLI